MVTHGPLRMFKLPGRLEYTEYIFNVILINSRVKLLQVERLVVLLDSRPSRRAYLVIEHHSIVPAASDHSGVYRIMP